MPKVKSYVLPPTKLIPNSPRFPLLHYPGLLADTSTDPSTATDRLAAAKAYDLFASNGWETQWIYRYGQTQDSHYHSAAHECMAVLSGTATIRFGVADTDPDLEVSTHGNGREQGGIEITAQAGDVFVLPAGVAHKTYDTEPRAEFALLTPGDGHHMAAVGPETINVREALKEVELDGFTMIGAYPSGSVWDFCKGGEHQTNSDLERVWAVAKPERDPVLGMDADGLLGLWQ